MNDESTPFSFELKFKGCPIRDRSELSIYMRATEIYMKLSDIDNAIRSRLKHVDMSEEEYKFLEDLRRDIEIWRYND